MSHRERQQRSDEERKAHWATAHGTIAMGLMLAFVLLVGALPIFTHPVAMLQLSLVLCPLAGWLATRCLITRGSGSRVHAWIALILIAVIVGGQLVALLPYIAPATWD